MDHARTYFIRQVKLPGYDLVDNETREYASTSGIPEYDTNSMTNAYSLLVRDILMHSMRIV